MKKRVFMMVLFCFMFLFLGKKEVKAAEVLVPNTELNVNQIQWSDTNTKLYEVTVDKEGYQRFKLEYRAGTQNAHSLYLVISDKNTKKLVDTSLGESYTYGNYYYKKGDKFYISFEKYYNYSVYENVFFTFETVEDKMVEKEENNTKRKANPVKDTIVGSIHGTNGKYEDVDFFKYKVTKTGYLLLDLTELNGDIRISLSGKNKTFWSRSFQGVTEESLLIPVKKGEYYFKVERENGYDFVMNYKIELENQKSNKYEMEVNDSSKEASPMNRIAALDSITDVDAFQTKIKKTGKYHVGVEFLDFENPHNRIEAETFVNGKKVDSKMGDEIGSVLKLKKGDSVIVVLRIYSSYDWNNIGTQYKVTCKKTK